MDLHNTQGLAEGSEMPLRDVIDMHMFPELIKAACSMYGIET